VWRIKIESRIHLIAVSLRCVPVLHKPPDQMKTEENKILYNWVIAIKSYLNNNHTYLVAHGYMIDPNIWPRGITMALANIVL